MTEKPVSLTRFIAIRLCIKAISFLLTTLFYAGVGYLLWVVFKMLLLTEV